MFPDSSRAAWLPSLGQQVCVIMSINGPSYLARVYYRVFAANIIT